MVGFDYEPCEAITASSRSKPGSKDMYEEA